MVQSITFQQNTIYPVHMRGTPEASSTAKQRKHLRPLPPHGLSLVAKLHARPWRNPFFIFASRASDKVITNSRSSLGVFQRNLPSE